MYFSKVLPLTWLLLLTLSACGGSSDSPAPQSDEQEIPVDPEPNEPEPEEPADSSVQALMLDAVNQARSVGRDCGDTFYPAVAALTSNLKLQLAAEEHSNNMANYDFFSHTGLDGSSVATRVSRQGYSWSNVGENIAAGQRSVEAAMNGWLNSSGHCANIMNANYRELGAAKAENASSSYGIYWTQVFAR
ncbi:CAP domain-containing protein [Agarivorans aestuarii]|uniref:CAP domain-containing protein n=1 Tax=Agarivorans aestuarii TaxID=1563703 RepID=A0ABU7G379_9ALTE|nr:CAP domain-containing protein [Agarivorans aestuarii]MEE1673760.1 CAP domain-containing protein [Agarivorans aestuarii]